jgi:hypothetical protein
MLRLNKRILGAAGAVVAAASLAVTGITAASARSSSVTGTEKFQLMTTSATATTVPVIAYGVFTKAGVSHTGSKVDTLVFSNGSFKVNHSKVPTKFKLNPKTCLLQVSGTGKVTLFGGTGAYKGISGTPTATLSILAIAAKANGKCSMTKTPVAFQQLIRASGTVTLP